MTLPRLRLSASALLLSAVGWAVGCATPQPMVEPSFASRAYTPSRIALLPPDVFVVLDQLGDNDPVQSAALGQAVTAETVRAVTEMLRSRGYEVDLSARWDGIVAQDGSLLASRDDLGWLANGVLQFANSAEGGGEGAPLTGPRFVAPEQAARVGWATQSDALLYLNVKGVTTSQGKRTATVLGAVFIVLIVAAIILATASQGRGGGSKQTPGSASSGGWRGQPVMRGSPPAGGMAATAAPARITPLGGGAVPRGRGYLPPPSGGRVYRGGPHVNVGIGLFVPLGGPTYTHDGTVTHEDELFAGDEMYVAMTLISAYDGRILWHVRANLDLDAEDPRDVRAMVERLLAGLPPRQVGVPAAGTPMPATPTPAPRP